MSQTYLTNKQMKKLHKLIRHIPKTENNTLCFLSKGMDTGIYHNDIFLSTAQWDNMIYTYEKFIVEAIIEASSLEVFMRLMGAQATGQILPITRNKITEPDSGEQLPIDVLISLPDTVIAISSQLGYEILVDVFTGRVYYLETRTAVQEAG